MNKLKQGLVQVYTGDGKGKTTAALGLAWRALGQGLRVCFIQFMKGDIKSGELVLAGVFGEQLTYIPTPSVPHGQGRKSLPGRPWWTQPPTATELAITQQMLQCAQVALKSSEYDLVICDEINVACHMNLISVNEVLSFIHAKPDKVELVLTGRNAKPEIIAAADLVTEMKKIKHPYEQNIPARKGIEF